MHTHFRGYRYGSAAQYGAEPLIQDKVIFVPIQYRLGTLGIMGDGRKEFGGNVAMFDMHAALQWVTDYISFFGGDKSNIKVMGHGSGASSAMFLSRSPYGRDSLNGVVAMSGSSLNRFSYEPNGMNSTEEIAKAHNCSYDNEVVLVKCLRSKSVDEIIRKDSSLQIERLHEENVMKGMSGMVGVAPNVEVKDDDRGLPGMITDNPESELEKEQKKKIPLLIGTNKDETAHGIDQNELKRIFKSFSDFLKISVSKLKFKGLVLNTTSNVMGSLGELS
jgi:carboxylesterase type B